MAVIPEIGFLRIAQILGCKKAKCSPIIPVSKSTWWEGVKSGRFPKPIKLGKRITVWKTESIRNLIENGVADLTPSKLFPKEKISAKKKMIKKKKTAPKSRG